MDCSNLGTMYIRSFLNKALNKALSNALSRFKPLTWDDITVCAMLITILILTDDFALLNGFYPSIIELMEMSLLVITAQYERYI